MRRIGCLILLAVLLCACTAQADVVGRWRSAPPANLLYEFHADRSIWLYQDGQIYRVFNYKLLDHNRLQLFDGMGRMREVIYRIEGDQLFFFDPENPEKIVEQFSQAR